MSGRIQSYFFSMSTIGHDLSPESRLIISAHKDNCGETLFTTGMHFERAAIGGRLTEYVLCLLMWMRFAWTTFADLPPPGTCPQVRQRLRQASGCKVRVRIFSRPYPGRWAGCH